MLRSIEIETLQTVRYLFKWLILVLPVSIVVGSLVALFLWLLELVTLIRWENEWLIYFLPLIGVVIVGLYQFKGKSAEAGNNLVIDEIHKPGGGIPFLMAPYILATTVVTHLFGGSAGREGTAVQIGGSMAYFFAKHMKLHSSDFRILLMAGVAAGFGAVFGTPVAATIFALEVLTIGKIRYDALLPSFMAALLAHQVCIAYGIHHTQYFITFHQISTSTFSFLSFDFIHFLWAVVAAVLFGLASLLFVQSTHFVKYITTTYIRNKMLIAFVGGLVIIGLTHLLGTTDYLGLGVRTQSGEGNSIVNAFKVGGVDSMAWLWKLIFTVITLSVGFKGGEVTPLFFIGAALGNAFATMVGAPVDLFAAMGFLAVFAAATNTPIACMLMGVEMFGGEHILFFAIATFVAYYFSGKSGIYSAQRTEVEKLNKNKSDFQR